MKKGLISIALLGAAALPALGAQPACNRSCLEGFVDKYMDAMEANKVSDELFAKDVKFTEDGIRLPLGGEGLWYGMSGKGTYRFYVPDIEAQQVAFIGTAKEDLRGNGQANMVAIALRLKIVNNKITEAEQIVLRPDNTNQVGGGRAGGAPAAAAAPARPSAADNIEKMGKPHPVYFETIPEARRMTRDQYIKVANFYFAGLAPNDGIPSEANGFYPFTDDCVRFENGTITTAQQNGQPVPGACKKQFETGLKGVVSRVRDRRFVAVDRERGIVFAFAFFDHYNLNWTWQLGELFKIEDGKIRRIEAAFHRAPFGINSGWSTYEQGISEEPRTIR